MPECLTAESRHNLVWFPPKTHQPLLTTSIYSPLPAGLKELYECNQMQPPYPTITADVQAAKLMQ